MTLYDPYKSSNIPPPPPPLPSPRSLGVMGLLDAVNIAAASLAHTHPQPAGDQDANADGQGLASHVQGSGLGRSLVTARELARVTSATRSQMTSRGTSRLVQRAALLDNPSLAPSRVPSAKTREPR